MKSQISRSKVNLTDVIGEYTAVCYFLFSPLANAVDANLFSFKRSLIFDLDIGPFTYIASSKCVLLQFCANYLMKLPYNYLGWTHECQIYIAKLQIWPFTSQFDILI